MVYCFCWPNPPAGALKVVTRNYCAVAQKALDAAGIVVDGLLGDTAGEPDPRWTHYETFEGKKSKVINDELMHEFGVPVRCLGNRPGNHDAAPTLTMTPCPSYDRTSPTPPSPPQGPGGNVFRKRL